jgi:hypothetical protein
MRSTDLHWIVQPEFVDGGLTGLERAKLRLLGRPRVTFIGPVFPAPRAPSIDLPEPPYFLCCAGTGGVRVDGVNSAELFAAEAERVAHESGLPGVMVLGPFYEGDLDTVPGLHVVPKLEGAEMAYVLGQAEFAMVAGGDMLGQSVALHTPCVAAAVGKDQPVRIQAYKRKGLCLMAEPRQLARVTIEQLDSEARVRMRRRAEAAGLSNGLEEAMRQIAQVVSALPA